MRLLLLGLWLAFLCWIFKDSGGGGMLYMIFSWAGFMVCFKKEFARGYW